MKKAIIVDIDGTLADITHRRHFVEKKPKDWKSFFDSMGGDGLNVWCKEIITAMKDQGYAILMVTGRGEEHSLITMDFLRKYKIPFSALFMRAEKDNRKDSIVKQEIYENRIKHSYEVLFCVEDRKQVVDMWREIGLTCLQCDEGSF